jgi:hypothetical protein
MMEEPMSKKRLRNSKSRECKDEPMIRIIRKSLIKRELSSKKMNLQIGLVLMISEDHSMRDLKRYIKKIFKKNNKIYDI